MTLVRQNMLRLVLASVAVVSLVISPFAFAHADSDKSSEKVRKAGTAVEVQINNNGRTLVRGAVVTAVSSSTITSTTSWGSSVLTWNVQTSGDTDFVQTSGGKRKYSIVDIAVGDVISFNGALNTGLSGLTVNASVVKNWTKKTAPPVSVNDTYQGILQSLASTTLPTSFVLKIGNTNYTVQAGTGAIVIGSNWMPTSLSAFQIGDTVRVFGSVSASSTSVIQALVVRNASR